MSKLNYRPRQLTSVLESKLSIAFRKGRERTGWYIVDGVKKIRFTIPHAHSSWGKGTINDIVRRSKLNKDEFALLVACPLTGTDYENLIRQRLP